MGIRSYVKNTAKNNVNVKSWASWDTIKANSKVVNSLVNDLKAPDKNAPRIKKTFDEAMKQYGLSEKDIALQMKQSFAVAAVCALLGLSAFGWMILLLFKAMFLSSLVAFSLSALMLAYAFREHFNYFQLKQRRLSCTFNEWFSSLFPRRK